MSHDIPANSVDSVVNEALLMADHKKVKALIRGILIACVGIAGLVLAGRGILNSTKERNTMGPTVTIPAHNTGIPLIDIAAPTETEMATFALG